MTDATQKPEEASAEELAKRDAGCLAAGHESQRQFRPRLALRCPWGFTTPLA